MKKTIMYLIVFSINFLCLNAHAKESLFSNQDPNSSYISTNYDENSDGYIHKGKISLRRVGSGRYDTFEYYKKGNRGYVKYGRHYYSLSGNRVTINNVQYFTK